MKYFTLAAVLALLYACSPNPNYIAPHAQTPAQHELGAPTFWRGDCGNATLNGPCAEPPATAVTPAPSCEGCGKINAPGHIEFIESPKNGKFALLTVTAPSSVEVVRVQADGRIFVHGKEVRTDAQYRAAIKGIMLGAMGCTNEKDLTDATRVEDETHVDAKDN